LPGVYTLGAAQIALKSQAVAIGKRVALVGAGPLLPLIAHQYGKAGLKPALVLDVTPFAAKVRNAAGMLALPATFAKGVYYAAAGVLRGNGIRYGVRSIAVEGREHVEAIVHTD